MNLGAHQWKDVITISFVSTHGISRCTCLNFTIEIKDELISASYVSLAIALMKKFGVNVEIIGDMDGTSCLFTLLNHCV